MKSSKQHRFSQVPAPRVPRSVFNRSHTHKTTFDAGYLIPIFWDEALPGDTFKMNATVMARLITPIVPIMDNLWLDTFYFSVPYRSIFDHWRNMLGEQVDPDDPVDFEIPQIVDTGSGWGHNTLGDYLGVPPDVPNVSVSALPFRAYNKIWNEWFRDQNLQDSAVVDTDDGDDDYGDYYLRKRNKIHDYFTSCLPWPQKGTEISMPLGDTAPVYSNGYALRLGDGSQNGYLYNESVSSKYAKFSVDGVLSKGDAVSTTGFTLDTKAIGASVTPSNSGLIADLDEATAATINSLREAFQLQRMLEKEARGGSRYAEIIKAHFGVEFNDVPNRPEYLGGSSQRIMVNSVTNNDTNLGQLGAYGVVVDQKARFYKSFNEHCIVMGLACVRADVTYQQGIERGLNRLTKYDHYWPSLANLGEQEVLNKEIYFQGDGETNDEQPFGYQERYAEYRYKPNRISGQFRSSADDTLEIWHLAQDFGSLPTLGNTFIQESPPVSRITAVEDEHQIKFDSYFRLICARPMPVYSVPGLIDHF